MKINSVNGCSTYNNSFGGRILTSENKAMVKSLKGKLDSLKKKGIPLGDCYCKLPENIPLLLKTNDKKYSAGISTMGGSLVVRRLENQDYMTISIAPDNDVKYWAVGQDVIENVQKDSPLAEKVNTFLSKVLPKFL